MRISDWSSDVCSSDLVEGAFRSFIIHTDQRRCGACLFKALSDHQRDSLIIMFYRRPRQHMRSMVACLAKLARIVSGNDGEDAGGALGITRSEEHTSELQSLMRISYAVFCLKNKIQIIQQEHKYPI